MPRGFELSEMEKQRIIDLRSYGKSQRGKANCKYEKQIAECGITFFEARN